MEAWGTGARASVVSVGLRGLCVCGVANCVVGVGNSCCKDDVSQGCIFLYTLLPHLEAVSKSPSMDNNSRQQARKQSPQARRTVVKPRSPCMGYMIWSILSIAQKLRRDRPGVSDQPESGHRSESHTAVPSACTAVHVWGHGAKVISQKCYSQDQERGVRLERARHQPAHERSLQNMSVNVRLMTQ